MEEKGLVAQLHRLKQLESGQKTLRDSKPMENSTFGTLWMQKKWRKKWRKKFMNEMNNDEKIRNQNLKYEQEL